MSPLQWSRIVGPPFWGWITDSRADTIEPKKIIQVSSFFAVLSSILLFFDWSFYYLFLVLSLVSFFLSGQMPIAESLTMEFCSENIGKYGKIRLWGSIGFIFAVLAGGLTFDYYGIVYIPVTLSISLLLLIFVSFLLPSRVSPKVSKKNDEKKIFNSKSINFLLASFFMLVAHAPLYTLYSLWLENNGYSKLQIGLIWSIGVLAEIIFFNFQFAIFKRFEVKKVWVFCFAITTLRFFFLAFSNGSLLVIVLTQMLHSLTFAAHHSASISLVNQLFPKNAQARGQSLYTMASYGLGGAIGGVTAGYVWENFFPEASFLLSVIASLFGIFFAFRTIKI
tara:strand:- start:680 stop:1687 length:1008 start_codon:yes stop_codon:yes gene_type:complete